jgi:hypothetical protein
MRNNTTLLQILLAIALATVVTACEGQTFRREAQLFSPVKRNGPYTAQLAGIISDDGLPQPSRPTIRWEKLSGPGDVQFANGDSPATEAIFTASGHYVLRLTASDGALESHDDVSIDFEI